MGESSKIEWTDHTFNPWIVTWGPSGTRKRTAVSTWAEPRRWNRQAKAEGVKRFVFCASLADVFEARDDLDPIRADLWQLIEECDGLTWLLLTKRPDEIRRRVPAAWLDPGGWPVHVWVGTSVEDQAAADTRIPHLLGVPAPVRFLSMEPLLGPVDLTCATDRAGVLDGEGAPLFDALRGATYWPDGDHGANINGIGWVIVGGESGAHARPMHPEWARSVRDQCAAANVPFFFKQWGEWAPPEDIEAAGRVPPDLDDAGWPRRTWPDSPHRHPAWPTAGECGGDTEVYRVGKAKAGRLLEGAEHSGRPEAT